MKKLLLVLLAIVSTFLFFCKQKSDVIKIGGIFAVTGPASFLGAPEERTAKMMVEKINAKGGINGKKIVLIIKDSAGDAEKAFSYAKQLIEEEKVTAIIGPSTSGESLKIKNYCNSNNTILISCAAAESIINPVAKYVFNVAQKDRYAAKKIFTVMKSLNIRKIGVVSSNTGFGKAGKEQLEKLAPEFNIQILISEVYDKAATDLTDVMNKLKAKNVEGIVNWSIEPAQSIVAKNMKQIGIKVPLFQSHGFGNLQYLKAAGAAAEGLIFPCGRLLVADKLPDSHPQKSVLMEYKTAYESTFGDAVSTFGGHVYDSFTLLEKAINKAQSFEIDKIRDALETLQGVVGTAGIFNMSRDNHNGLDESAFEMLTVKNGAFDLYMQ